MAVSAEDLVTHLTNLLERNPENANGHSFSVEEVRADSLIVVGEDDADGNEVVFELKPIVTEL